MKYNIIKKLSYLLFSFALIVSFVSCDQEESIADPSSIVTEAVRGTWVVDMTWDGSFYDHNTINTYNTSSLADNEIWIDDLKHGWGLKAKVNFDLGTLTFSASSADELYYGVTVNVTEGKIIKGGATAPSGDVVDSIYFKVEFSDIPGEIWEYSGYKSTAKIEDLP